jgi:hypothetical protein
MGKRKKTIGAVAVIVLLTGGLLWWWFRGDAQVEKVKQLQAGMFEAKKPPTMEQMDEMRREMDKLTPAQREEVMRPMRERMQQDMNKRMDEYFALSPQQRMAFLDAEIQKMEKWRKDFENRMRQGNQGRNGAAVGPPPGGAGGGPGGGPGMPGGGPPGGPKGGPGGGPGPGPWAMGADARKLFRNDMLDHFSPAQRAKMDAFFSDMQKRRIALGLSPMPAPPGPPPGRPR